MKKVGFVGLGKLGMPCAEAIAKKKYRVRMAPTLFIVVDGEILFKFKAGLDLLFPASLNEINEAIEALQAGQVTGRIVFNPQAGL